MIARFNRSARAVLLVELAVALALIGMLAALTAQAIIAHTKTRDHYAWRQAAAWAAEGQLERYRCGAPLDSLPPEGVIPEEIALSADVEPGKGQWESFRLVTVTARVVQRHRKLLIEKVAGYIPDEVPR